MAKTLKPLPLPKCENKRALVAIAHADDLLLFAGGAVIRLIKAGWQVSVVRATDDRWDSYNLTPEQSIIANGSEFKSAMAAIGVNQILELNLPTDQLADHSEVSLRKDFIRVIREFKPYLVMTFDPDSYLYEDNEDHKKVASAMAEACWAAGFDKHPNSGGAQLPAFLPVAKWYFGREVAQATHYLNVGKYMKELTVATAKHKTMLINMARQLELKAITAGEQLDITINTEQLLAKFAKKILGSGRHKKVKSVEYAEIFRVVDDQVMIKKLSKSKGK